jgi:hypothetical protein
LVASWFTKNNTTNVWVHGKKETYFVCENIYEILKYFSNHIENAKNIKKIECPPKAKIVTSEKKFNPNIIAEKPEFYSEKIRNSLKLDHEQVRYIEINDESCHENFRAMRYNLAIPLIVGDPIDLENSDFEYFEEVLPNKSIQISWRPKIDLVMKRQPIKITYKKDFTLPSDYFVEKFLGQIFVSDSLANKILEADLKDVFLQDPTYQKEKPNTVRVKTKNGTELIDLTTHG